MSGVLIAVLLLPVSLFADSLRGMDALLEHDAFLIAATGVIVVFIALLFVSVAIALLPRIIGWWSSIFPEKTVVISSQREGSGTLQSEIAAAVALAHREHRKGNS